MADNSSLIKLALFGGVGFLAYRWFTAQVPAPVAPAPVPAPGTPAPAPAGPAAPAPAPGVSFNSLDAIYQRIAAKVGSTPYTVHQFNYYLQQELPTGKQAPAPADFLPAGASDTEPMTLANYWGAVAPYLKTSMGLSGLGCYAELYGAMRGGLYGLRRAR